MQKKSRYYNEAHDVEYWIMGMEKDAVLCWLAVWSESPADAWGFKNDVRTNIITEFRKEGIEIHSINNRINFKTDENHGMEKIPADGIRLKTTDA